MNSRRNFSCGQYTNVDEMLVPFRGTFKYRVYMRNKPAKYSIKIFTLLDVRTGYFANRYIYCGSLNQQNMLLKPTQTVLSCVQPIIGTNRNVTADNYFSSIQLANEL